MSVTDQDILYTYTGNNSTVTPYVIPFKLFASTDLVVVKKLTATGVETTLIKDTDYTVASDLSQITTAAAIPNTYTVTVYRDMAATQPDSYAENTKLPAATIETDFDRAVMLIQQLKLALSRCLRFSPTVDELAPLGAILSSFLFVDSTGQLVGVDASGMQDFINNLQPGTFDRPMFTVANASERATATPNYTGQLLTQRDTKALYIATGTSAGSWTDFLLAASNVSSGILTATMLASTLDLSSKTVTLPDLSISAAKLKADFISSLSNKATPVNGDRVLVWDSATNTFKYLSYSQLSGGGSGVVQTIYAEYTSSGVIAGNIPYDNTVPQNTEGTQIISATITPTSASHKLIFLFNGNAFRSTGEKCCAALFRDSSANARTGCATNVTGNNIGTLSFGYQEGASTTGAITYKVNVGAASGNMYMNSTSASANLFGGISRATLIIQEVI